MIAFGVSDKGKVRTSNEDRIFLTQKPIGKLHNLFVVADGVGGRARGEIASSFATEKFCEYVAHGKDEIHATEILSKGIEEINKYIHLKSVSNYEFDGMATTFIAATIKDNKVYVANVGDCRMYLVRGGKIRQITEDNTYYNELKNIINQDNVKVSKNILSKAIGQDGKITVDTYEIDYDHTNSKLILCSDGLNHMLEDNEILEVVKNSRSPDDCANNLVNKANEKGGHDNVSVIVIGW